MVADVVKKWVVGGFAAVAGLTLSSCGKPMAVEGISSLPYDFTEMQRRGTDLPDKTLTLTFDDGPGPRTIELAEYLAQQGIQGTFFVLGREAARNPRALERLQELGHLVANHTFTHPAMTTAANPVGEVRDAHRVIEPYVNNDVFLFRAPYGDWNGRVSSTLNAAGLNFYVGSIFWDIGGQLAGRYSADWDCWGRRLSVAQCGQGYLNEARDRRKGIVLMHDNHSNTVEMVKWLVPRLKSDGFRFVRLDTVPNIAQAVRHAGGSPGGDIGGVRRIGLIECPEGYTLTSIGTEGGRYCTDGANVWGPFTEGMVQKCLSWGGGSACRTNRWATSLALSARGTGLCSAGAAYDRETTYCTEGLNAFGPFPRPLIEKCINAGGGEVACNSARWNRDFLLALMRR